MDELATQEHAVELLQQLGLKEYEAKSFVALSRLPKGTAKEISDISDVPRTRVYDAIRVLETKGLVEVQHSNPQQFRAVSVDEAIEILRTEYEERTASLRQTLQGLEPIDTDEETETVHEVWSLSRRGAIATRTDQLIDDAKDEIVLVIGHETVFTEGLIERLRTAVNRGVSLIIGTVSEELRQQVESEFPEIEVFVSELDWLSQSALPGDDTDISRLLLADRESILVSTFQQGNGDIHDHEQAVFGRGFDNGLVAITRRILATGLLAKTDPGIKDS